MGFDVSIRIAGEAGQGIQTIGTALCVIAHKHGVRLFANQDYMSRVRGGNNFYQIRFADPAPIASREYVDILLAMDGPSVSRHQQSVVPGGRIIYDTSQGTSAGGAGASYIDVPLFSIAKRVGGKEQYAGSVALGVVAGMLRFEAQQIDESLKFVFVAKGNEVVEKNIACAREGHAAGLRNPLPLNNGRWSAPGAAMHLIDGNEAIACGAMFAGCRLYTAYPMTPSTTIMETLARFSQRYPIIVEQAEDEIAAVNMAVGASFAGIRVLTGTSGGGFSLMTEGLSLAAMTETPIVIVDAQRPAPATGLPTRTEQADLDMVISAGHGEFARVVYAPGNVEEAFELTAKAFDVSEKYQIPVIILTDQYLADSQCSIEGFDTSRLKRQRHIVGKEQSNAVSEYRRYAVTESGISPQAVPSWINDVIYADSDEHDEKGHITEDKDIRRRMVDKRLSMKMKYLVQEVSSPVVGRIDDARIVLLGFGSTLGIMKEAADSMENVGFIHFPQVWPFPGDALHSIIAKAADGCRIIAVENNAAGQLSRLVRRETGIRIDDTIRKYDGRPFSVDEVVRNIEERGAYG